MEPKYKIAKFKGFNKSVSQKILQPKILLVLAGLISIGFLVSQLGFASDRYIAPSERASKSQKKLGVFTQNYSDVKVLEQKLGKKLDGFLWYWAITQSLYLNPDLAMIKNDGKILQVAWEPWDPYKVGQPQPLYTLKKITDGTHDASIRRWAREIKTYGSSVYFRPMSEMNGNWTTWSGTANTNVPADYVPAWRHVHDIFRAEGVTNVKWVWAVNDKSYPDTPENNARVYYPGNSYVDFVAINGYSNQWNNYPTFEAVFKPQLNNIRTFTSKPIMIAEMGAGESANKPLFISGMTRDLTTGFAAGVREVYWFNIRKEFDWRVESSPGSLVAYKQFMDAFRYVPQPKIRDEIGDLGKGLKDFINR